MLEKSTVTHVGNDADSGRLGDKLVAALKRVQPHEARITTAFVTPKGFEWLKDAMQGIDSVQLLLGERPFVRHRGPGEELAQPRDDGDLAGPAEEIDWHGFLEGAYPWIYLTERERAALLNSDDADPEWTKAFNFDAWRQVQNLVRFLRRDGVEVRRYLGAKAADATPNEVLSSKKTASVRLHAKAYLFRGAESSYTAVGSSNLTLGGLRDNIELSLTSDDAALAEQLAGWFDGKWQEGVDCRDEFISLLESCVLFGRQYTPWQVFIKALDAAYGRYLDLALSGDIAGKLAEFQQEAVTRCVGLLDRHWGAMLCDSVGLGKTFEGLGILGEYARRRSEAQNETTRALVVCPAQLKDNWDKEKFFSYGIAAETITMESLPQLVVDPDEAEEVHAKVARERRLAALQRYDVVLVDESHNFRNPATKRYQALQQIIGGGDKPDKRVVLLTATPINNTPWDLYWQLSLITRGDDTWYAGRGPIGNLRNTFRAIEKGGGGPGLLDAMLLSLVRRTRHDIRALQEAGQPIELNGEPMRFPKHEIPRPVDYSLAKLYGGIYAEIIDTIQHLTFAVYDLEKYGVKIQDTEELKEGTVAQRNKSFIGIMKTIFLKRMESSVVALTATVRSMVQYLDLFLQEMDRGRVLTPKDAQRLKMTMGGSLPDDAIEQSEWGERAKKAVADLPKAPADAERRERLRQAVEDDRARLASLLGNLETQEAQWERGHDPKVQALRDLLDSLPATDALGVPTKAVIFTNYKDTANYIVRSLGGPNELTAHRYQSNLKDRRWLSKLTGDDDHKRRKEVLAYFAPLAANREMEPVDDEGLLEKIQPLRNEGIDVLIATDVLSEGQNLQDAQYLINYDLPWNPVRIIQRAGRIDRLFSPHENVFIHNLMPEKELESLLKLVGKLGERIKSIEEMVGLDASVLGEQIEEKTFDRIMKLAAGGEKAEEVYREGEQTQGLEDAFAELNRYVQLVKDLGTEDAKSVPDGVYSIRQGDKAGVFIMLRMPESLSGEVYWRFFPLTDNQALETAGEVIKIIECEKGEHRLALPEEQSPFTYLEPKLRAAIDQLGEEYKRQIAERTVDSFTKKLAALLERADVMEAEEGLWSNLQEWRREAPPTEALNRARVRDAVRVIRQGAIGADLKLVLERLNALWDGLTSEGLDRPFKKPEGRAPSVRDLQLVCWELVLTPKLLSEMRSEDAEPIGR